MSPQEKDKPVIIPDDSFDVLCWRKDPGESFSDWRLETTFGGVTKKYHVHKTSLAFGPRSSLYFRRLFASGSFKESESSVSTVNLEFEGSQKAVPDMLDYIYHGDEKLILDSDNAVGLNDLADYFGIPSLQAKVREFLMKDMTTANVDRYCRSAIEYGAETFMGDIVAFYIKNGLTGFSQKEVTASMFWVAMAEYQEAQNKVDTSSSVSISRSRSWSCEVASLLPLSASDTQFDEQTTAKLKESSVDLLLGIGSMPHIDPKAAIRILTIDHLFYEDSYEGQARSACVQRRCIDALVSQLSISNEDRDLMSRLPAELLSKILHSVANRKK